eukprot:g10055.t1
MQERLLELRGAVIAATCPRGPSRYQALGVATDVAQLCPAQQKAWHQNYYNVKRRFCSVTGSSLYDGALLEFETHTCEENATSAAFMRKLTEAWKLCEIFRENVYPFVGAELRPNIMHVKATVAARTRSGECNRHAGGLLPWESWHVPSPPAVAVGTAGAGSSSQASSRSSSESNGTAGHQRRTAAAEQTSGPQGFFAALSHPDEDGADEGEGHHPQRQSLDEDGTVDGDLSGRLARLDVNVNGRREEGKNPTSLGKRARKKRDKAQEEQKSADELELLFDAWLAEEPFECRQQLFATSKRPKRQLYVEIALDLMFRRQTGSVYANKYEIEQWVAKRDNAAKEEFKISDEDEERCAGQSRREESCSRGSRSKKWRDEWGTQGRNNIKQRDSGAEKYLAHDQSVERGQWIGLAREGLGEEFSSHDFVQGSLRFLAFKDVPFLRQVAFRNRWKTALPDELFPDRNLMELLSLLEHTLAEGAGIELLSSPQKKEKVRTFLLGEEGKYAHGPPQLPGLLATGSSEEGGPRGRQQQNPAADNSKALYKWLSRRLDIPADLVQIFWASRETEVADRVTRILETKDAVNNMLWWAVVLLAGRGAGAGAGGSYYEMSSLIGMHYVSHRREAVEREIAQLLVHDASNQTRAAIRRAFVRLFPCARSSTFRLPGYALPR